MKYNFRNIEIGQIFRMLGWKKKKLGRTGEEYTRDFCRFTGAYRGRHKSRERNYREQRSDLQELHEIV